MKGLCPLTLSLLGRPCRSHWHWQRNYPPHRWQDRQRGHCTRDPQGRLDTPSCRLERSIRQRRLALVKVNTDVKSTHPRTNTHIVTMLITFEQRFFCWVRFHYFGDCHVYQMLSSSNKVSLQLSITHSERVVACSLSSHSTLENSQHFADKIGSLKVKIF